MALKIDWPSLPKEGVLWAAKFSSCGVSKFSTLGLGLSLTFNPRAPYKPTPFERSNSGPIKISNLLSSSSYLSFLDSEKEDVKDDDCHYLMTTEARPSRVHSAPTYCSKHLGRQGPAVPVGRGDAKIEGWTSGNRAGLRGAERTQSAGARTQSAVARTHSARVRTHSAGVKTVNAGTVCAKGSTDVKHHCGGQRQTQNIRPQLQDTGRAKSASGVLHRVRSAPATVVSLNPNRSSHTASFNKTFYDDEPSWHEETQPHSKPGSACGRMVSYVVEDPSADVVSRDKAVALTSSSGDIAARDMGQNNSPLDCYDSIRSTESSVSTSVNSKISAALVGTLVKSKSTTVESGLMKVSALFKSASTTTGSGQMKQTSSRSSQSLHSQSR